MNGASSPIDLAAEPDFHLGGLLVSPSACKVDGGAGETRVEPRVMEVLIVMRRSAGRTVTRDQLVDACWSGRAVTDDAVSRVIAKVRRLGRGVDPPHFVVDTVPRVGFRLVSATEPTVATQDTAERQMPLGGAERAQGRIEFARAPFGNAFGGTGVTIGAALTVMLLGIIAAWVFASGANDTPARTGYVVVSTFDARRSEPEVTRLARRAREVLARRLTAVGVPTVLNDSQTVQTTPDAELTVTGSADLVGDKYVIEGAIKDRTSGLVLWSSKLERRVGEVAGIDEEFGSSLAQIVRCALGMRVAAKTSVSIEVFSLVLDSCDAVISRETRRLEVTRRLVENAPALGGAHALRAFALAEHAHELDHLNDVAAASTREMRTAAARAIALDANTAFAYAALGARIGVEGRYTERERNLRRALEIDPDHAAALIEYSLLLREVGRVGAARETLWRLDAVSGDFIHRVFLNAMAGDVRTAHQMLDRLQAVRPGYGNDARWVVAVWWEDPAGTLPKLRQLAEQASRLKNHTCFETHLTALARGDRLPIRALPAACDGMDLDWKIRMLARQGDIDGAYELMTLPFPNSRHSHMFLFYPEMKLFRHDRRFMPLAERLGLLSYWRETNSWPDFCSDPDLPYDCRRFQTGVSRLGPTN